MCFRPAAATMSKKCPVCKADCKLNLKVCPECGAELPNVPGMPGAPGKPGVPGMPKPPGVAQKPEKSEE